MRVLVIGGTGFIGRHIVSQMVDYGHEVTIFHRGKTPAGTPKLAREVIDPHSVMPIINFPKEVIDLAPDVVIHTMAVGLADSEAAVEAFTGRAGRLVVLSSGDVYRAYGRFSGCDPGPIEEGLLCEDSPSRSMLFPYREEASSAESLQYWYEKIFVEQTALSSKILPGTVLRLPKVYGTGDNADLATVYRFRHQPSWRWTHGYVENVAAAVVLAATNESAAGRVYNVGEACTPTVAERLAWMPASTVESDLKCTYNFSQDIAYDTTRIRTELGYCEIVPEKEAILKTLSGGN